MVTGDHNMNSVSDGAPPPKAKATTIAINK